MRLKSLTPVAVAAAAALLILGGCASGSSETETSPSAEATAAPEVSEGACQYVATGAASREVDLPPADVDFPDGVSAVLATSAGDLALSLNAEATPCTVASFVSLAVQGYYDNTECHRLTTEGIYVLQCGDPTATGTGGPGYQYADELSGSETYPAGTVAMANAGPNTNGSQFFIVFDETPLPPSYTVFGSIDEESLAKVQAVAAEGTVDGGADGAPKTPVTITSVSVTE